MAKLTVSLGANWRLYANHVPSGSTVFGTVTTTRGETGALILTASGIYARLNAGAIVALPQVRVQSAIDAARAGTHGGPGRGQGLKAADGAINLQRVNITIDAECDEIAKRAGNDRSTGIREALRFWAQHHA